VALLVAAGQQECWPAGFSTDQHCSTGRSSPQRRSLGRSADRGASRASMLRTATDGPWVLIAESVGARGGACARNSGGAGAQGLRRGHSEAFPRCRRGRRHACRRDHDAPMTPSDRCDDADLHEKSMQRRPDCRSCRERSRQTFAVGGVELGPRIDVGEVRSHRDNRFERCARTF